MADSSRANPAEPGRGIRIVEAAKAAAKVAAGTAYTLGGKTIKGFDCSGFVYHVFRQVFPEYAYLTASGIAGSPLFKQVVQAQAGDVIYFPPGRNPYEVVKGNEREYPAHVGIIVDDAWWIGRQTSQIGLVSRANVWWASRGGVAHYRYSGLEQASTIYLKHLSAMRHA